MHLVQEAGFKVQKDAFRREAKYSRIQRDKMVFKRDENGEPVEEESYIQEIVSELWKSSWAKGKAIVPVLEQFSRG